MPAKGQSLGFVTRNKAEREEGKGHDTRSSSEVNLWLTSVKPSAPPSSLASYSACVLSATPVRKL